MRRVVIESPYAGNVTLNTLYARAALADCLKRGEAPFASHLLYTQPGVLDDAKPDERAKGIDAGHAWMQDAEVIAVYTDLGISEGMRKGIEAASKVNTTFANRPVIEFRTLPELMKAECIKEGVKWGFPFNFPVERKVPGYEGSPDIPVTPSEVSSTAMDSLCRELATAHAKNLTLTTRLKLANDALDLKIARIEELRTENEGLHEQVAGLSDELAQAVNSLDGSEHSRKELYEAIQPFARSGQQLIDYPPPGLVETNLFAAVKHETTGNGWWYQPSYHFPADLRAAAKYLKKA